MSRLTPEWTEATTKICLLAALLVTGLLAAAWEAPHVALIFGAVVLAVLIVGIAFEPFIGGVCGLMGAAGFVFAKRLTGAWVPDTALASSLQIATLLVVGWAAGAAGQRLRRASPAIQDDAPSSGSLGVLTADLGELRLEEEIDRALRYSRPLGVLWIEVRAGPDAPVEADDLGRVASRTMEAILRIIDIPFAYSPTSLVAILPETEFAQAIRAAARITDALIDTTTADRTTGTRLRLGDHAILHFGIAVLGEHGSTREALLRSARDAAGGTSTQGLQTKAIPDA